MGRGRNGALWLLAVLVLNASPVFARQAASASDPAVAADVGVVVGPGWPGTLAALRVSVPAWSRADIDADVGRVGWADPRNESLFLSLQFRVFDRPRPEINRSRGFIVGVNVAKGGIAPVFGYGIDALSTRNVRLGAELTTGGTPRAGPRAFVKVYVLWRPGTP